MFLSNKKTTWLVASLLGLFVICMRTAKFAELLHLEAIFESSLVFSRKVVDVLARSTFKLNHVVLRHIGFIKI